MFEFRFFLGEEQPALAELRVNAVQFKQLFVIAAFNNLPSVQNEDLVGVPNRRQTVRDDETCPAQQETVQRLLNLAFGFRIDAGSRLIKNRAIGGSFKIARAIEIRCFSPTLSRIPRSPAFASNPAGKRETNSSAFAARRAFQISVSLASDLAKNKFSRIVPLNRKLS